MKLLHRLRSLAQDGLARMYRPAEKGFVFCLRDTPDGVVGEGKSRRYAAIVLIGLATETEAFRRSVLGDHKPAEVYDALLEGIDACADLGDVALIAWAGTAIAHPGRGRAFSRLAALAPADRDHETVDVAWSLAALTLEGAPDMLTLRDRTAGRLLAAYTPEARVFPHRTRPSNGLRGHVACFADQVYPIQALSFYHQATGNKRALDAARACGDRIVEAQGPAGQWWWHYDARTGEVIEGYPVYSVHQHAMGPMALYALEAASGADYSAAIEKGLRWLEAPAEMPLAGLLDGAARVCWRKVARREPRRLARALQAAASGVHPSLRVPGVNIAFPPRTVDREVRPYEYGWLLHAFPPARVARLAGAAPEEGLATSTTQPVPSERRAREARKEAVL